ncbi:hypothetical protein Patl1_28053 [Pistacia atlantica]|uniref:Uncharacterized protein n=1 Tax=Pistacia atlantica TaxID=434234 RepID=A0ACC1BGP9_9ROSI|nr:hypothetical protein Patl1_28053 [Pistacia atlantica]
MWLTDIKFLLFFFFFSSSLITFCFASNVTYDRRSLIIDGQRKLLISAAIHYPRSVPAMWPGLIQTAKKGGADVIESYVFWNGHELSPGKYYFGGRFDLVKFVKIVQQAGMYMILRIGPFVAAEYNYGVDHDTEGYLFGCTTFLALSSELIMSHLSTCHTYKGMVDRLYLIFLLVGYSVLHAEIYDSHSEPNEAGKAFCTTGRSHHHVAGKLAFNSAHFYFLWRVVENEYGFYEAGYGEGGKRYALWAARMAVAQNIGVPWIMCQQDDAPDPVVRV